ncbi:hypothetical protein DXG01_015912 [Tephrocybe rancida]|nr:hypothetical protein DXG01_015912 [Tephrocybe rancida]
MQAIYVNSAKINVTLPQNTIGVFAELYASGNGAEEFWYFNVANKFISSLPSGTASQQGPFREVRLLVDNQIAGVAFPYATIFTGGIAPTAWRPITSYGALDLPTYFLDLTPFVPVFADGRPHTVTIDVASAEDDHAILQNWFVSGLLQVNTDESPKPTTGKITSYAAHPFATASTSGSVGDNGDVNVTITATRQIHIEAEIVSGSGKLTRAVWSQDLKYSNIQNYLKNTTVQVMKATFQSAQPTLITSHQNVLQVTSGTILSSHNNAVVLVDDFSYPLGINLTLLTPSGDSFVASFDHSYDRDLLPFPAITRSKIVEQQTSVAFFNIAPSGNSGNGTNNNVFSYSDSAGNTYQRRVNAASNNITLDVESGSLAPAGRVFSDAPASTATGFSHARLPGGRVVGI